jgi:Mrp family chromosome partitioning ATPase
VSSVYEALQRARQGSHGPVRPDARTRVAPLRPAAAVREHVRETPRPPVTLAPVTLAPGPLAAELGSLLAAIRPLLDGNGGAVLQVVAATQGEGTSTIAREFALLAATSGQRRTLLMDANRRDPVTARSFDCDTAHGLVELPWNAPDLDAAVTPVAGTLLSVACLVGQRGPGRTDAATLADLYNRLRDEFELIVVDCPAVASGDYLELAPETADGVILVVQAETTRPAVVSHAKGQIEQAGGNMLGAVLNRRGDYIPNFLYRML